MLTILAFIFVFGILVVVHEFGHFIVAKRAGVRVEEFSLGFGKKILKKEMGGTVYCLCLIPLGGYVKMAGETPSHDSPGESWEYFSKPVWQRFCILLAGPAMNYVLAFVVFSLVFMIGAPVSTSRVGGIMDEYPAKEAGLLSGDVIESVNGKKTTLWTEVTDEIRNSRGRFVELLIDRNGEEKRLSVSPKSVDITTILGKKETVKYIGIRQSDETTVLRYDPLISFYHGGTKLWQLTELTYQTIWALLTGQVSAKDSVSGPIGIFIITGEVARLGFIYLLQLLGSLSTALAIFNLLPIPVLDGGHMFFLLIEKIKGRPLSFKTQEIIMQIGLFLLLILIFSVSYYDISRFEILKRFPFWK